MRRGFKGTQAKFLCENPRRFLTGARKGNETVTYANRYAWCGVGRAGGVGRGLGVTLGMALGVGVAVGVPVGVGLTVAVGVAVGEGVGVGPA